MNLRNFFTCNDSKKVCCIIDFGVAVFLVIGKASVAIELVVNPVSEVHGEESQQDQEPQNTYINGLN
jgi:hypothetical protein